MKAVYKQEHKPNCKGLDPKLGSNLDFKLFDFSELQTLHL